jgi:hypothetical protein
MRYTRKFQFCKCQLIIGFIEMWWSSYGLPVVTQRIILQANTFRLLTVTNDLWRIGVNEFQFTLRECEIKKDKHL